ncbi:MAG TPA: arsinothricin resistance N-acetyltransferase ArsN1 family B [Solirubrobacteraceae bacterium]|jgi:phosphinothricin acetyltransferase
MLIRHADPVGDAAACAAVYAPFVTDSVASLEEEPPDTAEFGARMQRVCRTYPWLVAELDDRIVGFAYGSQHHVRAAYRWSADTTVYVSADHHRRGVGRSLYGELLPMLTSQGVYTACAGISLPNPASVSLHESFGFAPVGVYRNVGYKHGRWWDVGWWQLALREPAPEATPAELAPPPGRHP